MTAPEPVSAEVADLLGSCTTCRVWAEQDEGPYHRDAQPARRDIVEDRDGMPMQLGLRLASHNHTPVAGATVEVWHCDALGRYSDFPPPDATVVIAASPGAEYLPDDTFLRGSQETDTDGMVEFHTIYSGWYPGRTVHIHVIVRTADAIFTSQLYFPDAVSDEVLATPPYRERPERDTTNATDEIFPTGGNPAVVDLTSVDDGYRAAVCRVLTSQHNHGGAE